VAAQVALCKPDRVHLVTGDDAEAAAITSELVRAGTLIPCNTERWPGCYVARSTTGDVARVEGRTFICSPTPDGAGPTNNWVDPVEMKAKVGGGEAEAWRMM